MSNQVDQTTLSIEKDIVQKRIFLYERDVIVYREMPKASISLAGFYKDKLLNIIDRRRNYSLIIDLSDTAMGELWNLRSINNNIFPEVSDHIKEAKVITGKNIAKIVAARYVYGNLGFKSNSYHLKLFPLLKGIK